MPKALIVIDVQNYFINNYTRQLPKKIAKYIKDNKFDHVLFTKFVNKQSSPWVRQLKWRKMFAGVGTQIHKDLSPFLNRNNVFSKISYSALKSKRLNRFLKNHKVKELHLCGIDTDSCVLATAFDAFDAGFKIKILEKLSISHSGKDYHKAAVKIIRKNF